MDERFSEQEWDRLSVVPVFLLLAVADADGNTSVDEVRGVTKILERREELADPVHRGLLDTYASRTATENDHHLRHLRLNPGAELAECYRTLRRELTAEEYDRFVASVARSLRSLATADGYLDPSERQRVLDLIDMFGADLTRGAAALDTA